MAYVRPIVRVRENNRRIIRGGVWDCEQGRTVFQATSDEAFKVNVDFTDILAGGSLTATVESDGATVTSSVSSGVVTLTISAVSSNADIDLKATFSDGRIQQEFLRVKDPFVGVRDDYGPALANT
jgi:hypothetical protein